MENIELIRNSLKAVKGDRDGELLKKAIRQASERKDYAARSSKERFTSGTAPFDDGVRADEALRPIAGAALYPSPADTGDGL